MNTKNDSSATLLKHTMYGMVILILEIIILVSLIVTNNEDSSTWIMFLIIAFVSAVWYDIRLEQIRSRMWQQ